MDRTQNILRKEDSSSIKDVAITFIVFHNLIHLLSPIHENEFTFNEEITKTFINHIFDLNHYLWTDVFSFLGWYGICVFLFLSGYGLVQKYEMSEAKSSFFKFFTQHAKKLFLLMIIPYIIFLALMYGFENKIIPPIPIISQVLLISNFYSNYIHPGVYWFFGLMLQFYACYYLFIYKKPNTNMLLLIALQLFTIIGSYFVLDHIEPLRKYIWCSHNFLHNCIGWFLPFCLGIAFARKRFFLFSKNNWLNILILMASIVLLTISNLNFFSWLVSPIFAITAALSFNQIIKSAHNLNKIFTYLGSISAFLFATHPLVRYVYLQYTNSLNVIHVTVYFIVCVIIAIGYRAIHKKLFSNY